MRVLFAIIALIGGALLCYVLAGCSPEQAKADALSSGREFVRQVVYTKDARADLCFATYYAASRTIYVPCEKVPLRLLHVIDVIE